MDVDPQGPARLVGAANVPSGEELLLEVARGDQAAFAALYERFVGSVHGLVRRVVRDPAQAAEVTEEVLVEVWRTATRFDPARGSAWTWILTLAHRRASDRVRSVQSGRARDAVAEPGRPAAGAAAAGELRFEHQQVRQALHALTDPQRETVELAYHQGYTYREVAELLGAAPATTSTRMRDGLIRLRDALGVGG
jgi:RNA polymerase sigma-70 factor, ECF subfamily